MQILLLSGGSGKRLWPLSNEARSKQFIPLFRSPEGEPESMVQRVLRQLRKAFPDTPVTVATGRTQGSALKAQLGESVSVCVEPCRRDTFPAIALASAFLRDEKKISADETLLICPIDPFTEDSFFEALKELDGEVGEERAAIALLGITPTYPSEKYGYILPEQAGQPSAVRSFREKPSKEDAESLIREGALWNAGVFACRLSYLEQRSRELIGTAAYTELLSRYEELEPISFDYAVVEKETSLRVIPYEGTWKDVGTWNTLVESVDRQVVGEGTLDASCEGTHILNELNLPILAAGLKDVVIAASPQGILISDKEQSSYIKPLVDALEEPVRFAEKSWGSYRVIDEDEGSLTIKVTLLPGHAMHYHSHRERDEVWVVTAGTGRTVVDGMEQPVRPGDVITMSAGCKHTVIAESRLQLVEVQLGASIRTEDKERFDR